MKYVVQNVNLNSPYGGNLINSLFALEREVNKKNIGFVYLFPETANEHDWVKSIIKDGKIVFFRKNNKILPALKEICIKYNIDCIHTHFGVNNDFIDIKKFKLLNPHIKTVTHHHCMYFRCKNPIKEFVRKILSVSNSNIACGKGVYDALKKAKVSNVWLVENCIEFSRLDKYIEIDKKEFGISSNQKMILIFGHLYIVKGIDLAIRMMEKIRRKHNVVLGIVLANDEEFCKKQISEYFGEIPEWIKLLSPRKDVASYYKMTDIFLSASRHEGFCYSVIEAAYCGCKLVLSDIPGNATDIPGAIVYESENIQDAVNKINEYYNHNNFEDGSLVIKQKNYVMEKYGIETWCKKIIEIYKALGIEEI